MDALNQAAGAAAPAPTNELSFLAGGGEMGARIRAYPWSTSPIGPPEQWPVPLRTAVRIMLTTNHPVFIFWGPEHVSMYNDAYSRSLGPEKNPAILGMPGRLAWQEIWSIIGPQIEQVMTGGGATWHENQLVPIIRHGRLEDVYWTYSYGPIDDASAPFGVGGVLVLCTETTAQVVAEQQMRASESRFRVMADGVPVLIWVTDAAGSIEFVNRGYSEFFGVTRDEVAARGWQPFVHPEDAADYVGAFEAARRAHTPFHARARVAHVTRGWRWIESIAQPRFAANGAYIGHVGISPDVTDVVDAQHALAEADRRKDEFLATLAHELRNPLAPIRNATAILRNAAAGAETREWAVNVVDRQVRAMSRLLDDLLDIGRITRGKLTLSMRPIAARAVIDAAVETAMPLLDARRHRLTVSVVPENIVLTADALRLAQALSNLLTNAAKYTEPGGAIELAATVEAGDVVLAVTDNGIGLEPSSIPQLFAMFGQVESALHRAQGGLGIGLALVKAIAELHDGTAGARSEGPGRGSTFFIRVPLRAPATAIDAVASGEPAARASASMSILVADDNADASDSLAAMLMLHGHRVRIAYDGEQALAALLAERPQVALLDIGMPGLNGYDVARRLRAQPWSDRVRLVAITGWGQEHDRANALAAGFDAHVTKPVDVGTLLATLRALAEKDVNG